MLCSTHTCISAMHAHHAWRVQQHPVNAATVAPPFGSDPALAAMLCRTVAEATLPSARGDAAVAVASFLSMHAPEDDHAWGRRFVATVHDLREGLPSSQALVRVCRGLSGNTRCTMLRQALAMASLEAMHGGSEVRSCMDLTRRTL